MLAALASAQAARDPTTAAHCSRVTYLAMRLAEWIGWDDRQLRTLEIGARLHDIGKVMISDRILRKRGPLRLDELAEIRKHPAAGASLIGPIAHASAALTCVLCHHERWDGTGYPRGLARTAIPEEARLLAIADAFDAMTSTRPYRTALPISHALQEIANCAGTQFDPVLARAFLQAWDAGAFSAAEAASR